MYTVNSKVNFCVKTARKNARFQLSSSGQLTIVEPMTKKELKQALIENFLEEFNKPLTENLYTASELRVSLS